MPIIYGLIAKRNNILVEASSATGNFNAVARKLLGRLTGTNMSYVYDNYTFHYSVDNELIYLCMTDQQFDRKVAFSFLIDIKNRFLAQFGIPSETLSSVVYQSFSQDMKKQMEVFSDKSVDRIQKVKGDVDDLRIQVEQNIDKVLDRQEKIELLVDKTDELNNSAQQFKRKSTQLKRAMWWKNVKLWIVVIIVILLAIFLIVLAACGGFTFKKCRKDTSS